MAVHTMALLQAYQADVLKEMDEGRGLTPGAVKELRKATVLRATKPTACAVGRSMAGSVAAERHLWRFKEICFSLTPHLTNWTIWGGSQLCGGQEIWEADDAFASIRRQHKNVDDGIRAISQWIGVIILRFRPSAHPRGVPKAS